MARWWRKVAVPTPLLVACLALALASCGGESGTAEARSDLERTTSPGVTAEQRAELASGNTAFAVDLYRELAGEEGNLFFSPHSISVALAMTYAGARGATADEMAETLHFTLPEDRVHAALNALDLDLATRSDVEDEKGVTPPELSIANSTWGDRDTVFLEEFLDVLALHYDAGMRLVDFRNEPESARQAINAWVEERTKDRIRELVPEGVISPATVLVLANAIYFKASWERPFDEEDTSDGAFRLLDGSTVSVPIMRQDARFRYAEVDGAQAVELPYVGGKLAMVVVLPPEDGFAGFEQALDPGQLQALDAAMGERKVDLALPRFEFESAFLLNEVLETLGMPMAFSPGAADFSGIDGSMSLYISAVLHKAFVAVDEKGTEAAAATAVVIDRTSAPEPATMTVDRPFLVLIKDLPTGAILFMGRVVDPS